MPKQPHVARAVEEAGTITVARVGPPLRPEPWRVRNLRQWLADLHDDDALVILYSDAEGNQAKPVLEAEYGYGTVQIVHGYGEVDEDADVRAVYLRPYD